ncbi:MAG TPA: transposase [Steroidobacteraceae bacterium]|nr:transposase [Steroidobacteraceae bacterium]
MKKQSEVKRKQRNHYSTEYKRQAVLRSDQEGVEATASALGLKLAQLYAWRSSQKSRAHDSSPS